MVAFDRSESHDRACNDMVGAACAVFQTLESQQNRELASTLSQQECRQPKNPQEPGMFTAHNLSLMVKISAETRVENAKCERG